MPLYEYYCPDCRNTFEQLRPASQADAPAACPGCDQTASQRILSLFSSTVKTHAQAGNPMPAMGGSCCGGGACGCH